MSEKFSTCKIRTEGIFDEDGNDDVFNCFITEKLLQIARCESDDFHALDKSFITQCDELYGNIEKFKTKNFHRVVHPVFFSLYLPFDIAKYISKGDVIDASLLKSDEPMGNVLIDFLVYYSICFGVKNKYWSEERCCINVDGIESDSEHYFQASLAKGSCYY